MFTQSAHVSFFLFLFVLFTYLIFLFLFFFWKFLPKFIIEFFNDWWLDKKQFFSILYIFFSFTLIDFEEFMFCFKDAIGKFMTMNLKSFLICILEFFSSFCAIFNTYRFCLFSLNSMRWKISLQLPLRMLWLKRF